LNSASACKVDAAVAAMQDSPGPKRFEFVSLSTGGPPQEDR
jgi:hypothetical protein